MTTAPTPPARRGFRKHVAEHKLLWYIAIVATLTLLAQLFGDGHLHQLSQ